MANKIISLPLFIQKIRGLEYTPMEVFKEYEGFDWKPFVRNVHFHMYNPYPVSLWNNHNQQLILKTWNNQQVYSYYTNKHIIYTKILEGKLIYTENSFCKDRIKYHHKICNYNKNDVFQTNHDTHMDFKSPNVFTVSLHLYQNYSK